jgi:hypothetical protein
MWNEFLRLFAASGVLLFLMLMVGMQLTFGDSEREW